jgi:biotin carboxyl carrier protein
MREYLATILGAGLLTFPFLGQPKILQAPPAPTLQKAPAIQLKKSESKVSKRHRVQVQVISLSDLKISEGSQVVVGQIISDRTEERQSLEAQKEQIEISIKQLSTPLSQVAELPSGNFSIQEAAIARIKSEIELLDNRQSLPATPAPFFRFKDEKLQKLLESEKLNKIADGIRTEASERARISEAKAKLALELNQAIAALDKARSDYQHQQYQHSLNLIRQQTEMQRQQYQAASLIAQKQEIESKLAEITQIKSPVSGKIRRIKNLGQKDRQISLEIVIDVRQTDPIQNN